MSATYEVTPYSTNLPTYRVAGVGKVRFRDEYLWFWDTDGNPLLVVLFGSQRIVERTDVDASRADEDVVELIDINAPPIETATVQRRIPGVVGVDVKVATTNQYIRAMILESDDDDLPAGLVNARWYSLRRRGASITTAP